MDLASKGEARYCWCCVAVEPASKGGGPSTTWNNYNKKEHMHADGYFVDVIVAFDCHPVEPIHFVADGNFFDIIVAFDCHPFELMHFVDDSDYFQQFVLDSLTVVAGDDVDVGLLISFLLSVSTIVPADVLHHDSSLLLCR